MEKNNKTKASRQGIPALVLVAFAFLIAVSGYQSGAVSDGKQLSVRHVYTDIPQEACASSIAVVYHEFDITRLRLNNTLVKDEAHAIKVCSQSKATDFVIEFYAIP